MVSTLYPRFFLQKVIDSKRKQTLFPHNVFWPLRLRLNWPNQPSNQATNHLRSWRHSWFNYVIMFIRIKIGIPAITSQYILHVNKCKHNSMVFASLLKSNLTLNHHYYIHYEKNIYIFIATATLSGLKLGFKVSLISLNAP